jgi:GNAT superfamily N-acetyltransferase
MSKSQMVSGDITSPQILLRHAVERDQPGVMTLAEMCGPHLTRHAPYIHYIFLHCNGDTCRVAEANGKIVGYCSVLPFSSSANRWFFHQLGVHPDYRKYGVAQALILDVLDGLRSRTAGFELEFTINMQNKKVLFPIKAAARIAGMRRCRSLGRVELFDESVSEELFLMTFPGRIELNKSRQRLPLSPGHRHEELGPATWTELRSAALGFYD